MNRQEVFNRVYAHALTMENPSTVTSQTVSSCVYRGKNGSMCLIGSLISDAVYSDNLEGRPANNPVILNALSLSGIHAADDNDAGFLNELQRKHDEIAHLRGEVFKEQLRENLHRFAYEWALQIPENSPL